ncbi:carbonic anhydrase [Singulisphaera sp. GP187]|uniref:carbonic anhydrase family protein n=1 Tax=Singulisphaera sp. GP187 TaxID=1882752 RepID=UPI00092B0B65|nr:carbonic anhydrase family protein [Singulisphaera sp. GP187]SIO34701.1 carbonic anhydrase [Singulisphaera sp. GP187]
MQTLGQIKNLNHARRNRVAPNVEGLETRLALSGSHATMAQPFGTIAGQILNEVNGHGLGKVTVQLVGSNGQVVATTHTGPRGRYAFHVKSADPAPYVVHAVTPKRFIQTSPTFDNMAPTGAYATNPLTGKPYAGANWNYRTGNNNPANGPVGPAAWSKIAPAGALPFESPINITGAPIDLSQVLSIHYNDATPKAIINNGAQIQAQFNSSTSDSIVLDGQTYELSQFHYHDTAENQVAGYTYPMEEHFVNVSASGAETVVAVFLQLGSHNAALQPILDAASAHLTSPNSTTTIATPIDFAGLLPSNLEGWFYEGSLTTPPLSQTVNWLVLSTPITLDAQQLHQYEAVANGAGFLPNNRPLQPTNGRQANQFNIDVNYQGQSIGGANFTFAPRNAVRHELATASTTTSNV